jgi:hypothetical protein
MKVRVGCSPDLPDDLFNPPHTCSQCPICDVDQRWFRNASPPINKVGACSGFRASFPLSG